MMSSILGDLCSDAGVTLLPLALMPMADRANNAGETQRTKQTKKTPIKFSVKRCNMAREETI